MPAKGPVPLVCRHFCPRQRVPSRMPGMACLFWATAIHNSRLASAGGRVQDVFATAPWWLPPVNLRKGAQHLVVMFLGTVGCLAPANVGEGLSLPSSSAAGLESISLMVLLWSFPCGPLFRPQCPFCSPSPSPELLGTQTQTLLDSTLFLGHVTHSHSSGDVPMCSVLGLWSPLSSVYEVTLPPPPLTPPSTSLL